jgi:uncharacterized protein (TIGR02145 family)
MKPFTRLTAALTAGLIGVLLVFISCDKGNLPPVARITAFPSAGDTSVSFEFNAGGSKDDRDFAIALEYRWDFDGDGIWETGYSKASAMIHQFTQPGKYNVTVGVKDIDGLSAVAVDPVEVFGKNPDIDTLFDSRDGNKYRIVKIGGRWWMAENLRYGIVIPTDREQTDNDTVEMYRLVEYGLMDTIGGVYLWYEARNYRLRDPKGICPDGWHLPAKPEWEALFKPYPHLYSLQYYRKDGPSNLNLDLNNGAERWADGTFWWMVPKCWNNGFWSSSDSVWQREYHPYFCSFNSAELCLVYGFWENSGLSRYYSVRCVKDN